MQFDESLLPLCRNLVEKKVGWGDSSQWTRADFEILGERIFSETGVSLSASTLKRLWGKVRYTSEPQVATLNALVRFVGYQSFRDFESAQKIKNEKEDLALIDIAIPDKTTSFAEKPKELISRNRIFSIGLVVEIVLSLLLAFSLTVNQKPDNKADASTYTFSSRPVSEGLPNSVVFTFDVSSAKTDSLFVQQSWDPMRRIRIKSVQKQATSIYYYPGFYKARLIVGDSTMKEHDLLIKTKGWLPLVKQQPVPVYFKSKECIKDGIFGLTAAMLQNHNVPLQPTLPLVSYHYVQDLGNLSSDSFSLETSLKNTYPTGSGACQKTQVVILCENTAMTM